MDSSRVLGPPMAEPMTPLDVKVEANRCLNCYDAPCIAACPTSIDIPLFIREIAADNALGAARTILESNIMGGMCARVCPTETLCEEACVREHAEGKPVRIGLLQRHAGDAQMATGKQPFTRAAPTGKRIAIVGAGPRVLPARMRSASRATRRRSSRPGPSPAGSTNTASPPTRRPTISRRVRRRAFFPSAASR